MQPLNTVMLPLHVLASLILLLYCIGLIWSSFIILIFLCFLCCGQWGSQSLVWLGCWEFTHSRWVHIFFISVVFCLRCIGFIIFILKVVVSQPQYDCHLCP